MNATPISTVDVVLLTLRDGDLHVLLHRRAQEPYPGQLALPGGYIHTDADADTLETAYRVLRQKGKVDSPYLEQLYTFGDSARDPRGWSLSVAYYALVPASQLSQLEEGVALFPVASLPRLAFDHNRIIETAVERIRGKAAYSALPCFLLPEKFTLAELQRTYEEVLGAPMNKGAFRRKLEDLDFVEPVEGELMTGKHRPAQLYRVKPGRLAVFNKTL